MKFEKTEVWGFDHAIRGMRNPMESWAKSDSAKSICLSNGNCGKYFAIGRNDLHLMQKLIKAGSEHCKFMRQIFVSVDITAPLYWWKEFDTYKIGTVADSCSTMHKLACTEITKECFEQPELIWNETVIRLEKLRQSYNQIKLSNLWKELVVNLPESWLQKRTVTMNYENILNMTRQRRNHKLTEWSENFIAWARSLPYAIELLLLDDKN